MSNWQEPQIAFGTSLGLGVIFPFFPIQLPLPNTWVKDEPPVSRFVMLKVMYQNGSRIHNAAWRYSLGFP